MLHLNESKPSADNPSSSDNDPTTSFLINFGIGAAVFLFVLILYDLLRYFFPGHCYYRATASRNAANNNYDGTPLRSPERPPSYPLSWIIPTLRYPMSLMIETHGLDAAMFLRFLQTQATIFFALTIYSAIVLIPTYATAQVSSSAAKPLGLERASLVNIGNKSPRLWVTLASEIAVLAIILVFLYFDMRMYTDKRVRYRADNKRNPSNFAILIMDIPSQYRDQAYLFEAFSSIFPGQVIAVHPVRDAHHLHNLKMRYITAVNKRQRAELSTAPTNSPRSPPSESNLPTHTTHTAEPVSSPQDAHDTYERPQISSYVVTPDDNNPEPDPTVPFDAVQADRQVEADLDIAVTLPQSAEAIFSSSDLSTSQQKTSNSNLAPTSGTTSNDLSTSQRNTSPSSNSNQAQTYDAENEEDSDEIRKTFHQLHVSRSPDRLRSDHSSSNTHFPSPRLRALTRTQSNNMEHFNRQVAKARRVLEDVEKDIDQCAPVTHAAFVVFRSRVTTTCAVTTPVFPSTSNCKVFRAPDPRAVNWNRINISRYTTRIREYVSFSVLTAMTLVWTLPSTFIQALRNLSTLAESFKSNGHTFLKDFVENNPGVARFLENLLPALLLFLVLLIVPQVFRFIISFERIPSQVRAENKVRNFLFFFYVMSNFVYQVSLGSFLEKLEETLNNPREIINFLSSSVPGQATFLMKYVLTNSFLGSVLGMLNMGRLLFRPLVIWRAKTERDKIRADRLFADYPFAKMYALCMMISLISYVYATIAPIINAVAFLYFALAYLCSKQLLLYSHRPMFEGGGFLFRDAWTGLLIGLYVHQLAMIGIFSLKKAPIQATLSSVTLAFSVWFTVMCRNRFLSRIEHGSLLLQSTADDVEEGLINDEIPKEFINMYIHPGLKPVEVLENTAMDPATASLNRRTSRRHSIRPPAAMMESFVFLETFS